MSRYRVILFDLFDTVALFDRERMPTFTFGGTTTRATTGALQDRFERSVPDIPFARFVAALDEILREQQAVRGQDLREVACATRFARTLVRAGLPPSASTDDLARDLAQTHSALIGEAAVVPPGHTHFLRQLATTRPIALVSNFDDGVVARQVLERGGVLDCFSHIVISVDHGWRKPDRRIFRDTLEALGASAGESLFVGDSPDDDVRGAKEAGMDVAWVNAAAAAFPAHLPAPDFVVPDIPALARLVGLDQA